MIRPYKRYLLTPGPTPVPEDVLLAQARHTIHHRTEEFREILKDVFKDLQYVFQSKNPVLLFASSGTGAMEAAVANLIRENSVFLVIVGGKFGQRWLEICKSFGVKHEVLEIEWGTSPPAEAIEEMLKQNPKINIILTTLCETSTGVIYDVKSIAELAKRYQALTVIDAISGLLADELRMDEWGIDVVVGGSQKGFMLPPGLSFISLSEKAWNYVEKSNAPKYYFDLKRARDAYSKTDTAYTPAVNLIIGLKRALEMIKEEGIEEIWKRHSSLASLCREAIQALGLKLFADRPSNAVTSVLAPVGIDTSKLVKFIRQEYGITIAGGQAKLKGKIFRIAHLGYMNVFDLLIGIAGIEFALHNLGYKFKLGEGILKLEESFLKKFV